MIRTPVSHSMLRDGSRAFASSVLSALFLSLAPAVATISAQSVTPAGSPSLVVSTAVAGFELSPATDATATVTVTTSGTNQKILARLSTALPPGVSLTMSIAPPTGATGHGNVSLTTSDQNIVTGLPDATTYSNLSITYTLTATTSATIETIMRTVVISLAAGP